MKVPHEDITYFKRRGETLKVHSIRYSKFSISPQITNRYCASSCIKLISNITMEFYAFYSYGSYRKHVDWEEMVRN